MAVTVCVGRSGLLDQLMAFELCGDGISAMAQKLRDDPAMWHPVAQLARRLARFRRDQRQPPLSASRRGAFQPFHDNQAALRQICSTPFLVEHAVLLCGARAAAGGCQRTDVPQLKEAAFPLQTIRQIILNCTTRRLDASHSIALMKLPCIF